MHGILVLRWGSAGVVSLQSLHWESLLSDYKTRPHMIGALAIGKWALGFPLESVMNRMHRRKGTQLTPVLLGCPGWGAPEAP